MTHTGVSLFWLTFRFSDAVAGVLPNLTAVFDLNSADESIRFYVGNASVRSVCLLIAAHTFSDCSLRFVRLLFASLPTRWFYRTFMVIFSQTTTDQST